MILCGNEAQSERATVFSPVNCRLIEHGAPCEDCVASEQRRDVPTAVDRRNGEGVGKTIEGKRPREADDVAAIDQAPAKTPLTLGVLVKMNARRVLIEARRHHVLGLFDGYAVEVIDLLAFLIVIPEMGTTR